MKNTIFIFIILSLFSFSSCLLFSDDYQQDLIMERQSKDSSFLIEKETPFSVEQIASFSGLKYYPITEDFIFKASLVPFDEEQIIKLKTSTERLPEYIVYGYVFFEYKGAEKRLTAYQSVKHQHDSLYNDLLFLPFTDNNSTITTYGGGRYVDFKIPEGEIFILDFNKAYNPYCAYNHKWSCVIPPRENTLDFAVDAGEKVYLTNH